MYRVGVLRDFIAQHYLIGGDWGAENQLHSHPYRLELELSGKQLDQHQYLVDIVAIEQALDRLIAYYRDHTLNDLPEFAGINPSLEHFARVLCESLAQQFLHGAVERISVKLWENSLAWAGYEVNR
ncbi:6-pyruvoyl-tetrahydropterin synthase [Bellilinea caldifistulae]|uniref:6-carboxy-5,6,7,8-tetrahydropterin synthase n=1 Tax=Bellilinea caldifistulae TaxID=360411 RepID=A0A0P6XE97_9CHLR|nr:6-carboxytetrahydropterin synthase [Bellilinea caldifistulae]KPL78541.1 6-pyruvoyl tetrahydropterin synthase [Bellilinea caldifistulae]GAP11326.1 6-pyruvoyl-tetrahydropterin synthase [Bellilinea caldifistulae]GIV64969.1 MAG: 6-pyruvoyltetrahydropterin synthase [Bellilinea sp.]